MVYLSQRDTSNHCNFGQPMTVASSQILILIFVAILSLKRLQHEILALKGIVARGLPSLVGL